MPNDDLDPITRLVQACNPNEVLQPSDPRYVDFDDARGGNIIERMARAFRRAREPDCKLFAGHRGIGKTSELMRLKQLLENPQNGGKSFVVVFVDATRQLDSNDLDFPDLLVLLAGEVQKQLQAANVPGYSATSGFLQRLWDDLKKLLGSDVQLKSADIEVPFGSLALELRNRPGQRALLREKIEALATDLLEAVNQMLSDAHNALRAGGRAGLVLIVDGLDKISRRPLEGGSNTHDRLFIDRSEHLTGLRAHTVYAIPISMFYSPRCAVLEQSFGEFNTPVSMIRVRGDNHSDPTAETVGMQRLWEMVDLRCKSAEVNIGDVFDTAETCHHLCRMSGGHPRHLLILLCAAANLLDELPITRAALDQAVREYANSLLREIPDRYWTSLQQFDQPQYEFPKDDDHQEMLFLLHVFEYMNGRPWYEINPVLRTLERFQQGLTS